MCFGTTVTQAHWRVLGGNRLGARTGDETAAWQVRSELAGIDLAG